VVVISGIKIETENKTYGNDKLFDDQNLIILTLGPFKYLPRGVPLGRKVSGVRSPNW
jgi:hypothetical protein